MHTFSHGLAIALVALVLGALGSAAGAAPLSSSATGSDRIGIEDAAPLVEEVRHRRSRCRWTVYGWVRWTPWGPVRCRPKFRPKIFFDHGGFDPFPGPSHCVRKIHCDDWGCRPIKHCF